MFFIFLRSVTNNNLNRVEKSNELEECREKSESREASKPEVLQPARSTSAQPLGHSFNTNTDCQNSQNNEKTSQRHSIAEIAQEVKQRYGSIDTGNLCDLCKKTKFTSSSVGQTCFSCKSRCCIRCAFKYSTKSKVRF